MEFKLNKYWDSWLICAQQTWGQSRNTRVCRWDNFDWFFGGKSVTIPPLAVELFIKEKFRDLYQRNNLTLKIFLVGHQYSKKEVAHLKGDFLDYLPEREFDMGFFLSMDAHVRPVEVLPRIKKLLYLEGHAAPEYNEEHYRKMLAPYFKNIELLGELPDELDQGKRRLLFKASNG